MDTGSSDWYQAGFQLFASGNPYGSPQHVVFVTTTVPQQYLVCASGFIMTVGAGGPNSGSCYHEADSLGFNGNGNGNYEVDIRVDGQEAIGQNPTTHQPIDYGCHDNVNFQIGGVYLGHMADCAAYEGGGMVTVPFKPYSGINYVAFRDNTLKVQDSDVTSPTNTTAYYSYSSMSDTYAYIGNTWYRPNFQNQACDGNPPPNAGTYVTPGASYQTVAGTTEATCPNNPGPYGAGSNNCGGSYAATGGVAPTSRGGEPVVLFSAPPFHGTGMGASPSGSALPAAHTVVPTPRPAATPNL